MKFGPIDLNLAEGAVLAHSVTVTGGRLRKGRILSSADIATLGRTGRKRDVITLALHMFLHHHRVAIRRHGGTRQNAPAMVFGQVWQGRDILARPDTAHHLQAQ